MEREINTNRMTAQGLRSGRWRSFAIINLLLFTTTNPALANKPYLVKDIKPGPSGSSPSFLTKVGDRLFFNADDGVHGQELWVSDGTEEGTYMVIDLVPGPDGSVPQRQMADLNGRCVFYADNNDDGFDLYISDGTAEGTVRLGDMNPGDTPNPNESCVFHLYEMKRAGNVVFFESETLANVESLWKTDGTPQGTVFIKQVTINQVRSKGSDLFFAGVGAGNSLPGFDLWKSDGTAEGTVMLKDLGGCIGLTESNGLIFFEGEGIQGDDELWVSDGTPEGTRLVKDINPGPNPSHPGSFEDVNGTLFFSAWSPGFGREIWKSDGTEEGTQMLADLLPGPGSGTGYELTNVDGTLFFARFDSVEGWQLWKSDGTTEGTVVIKTIAPPSVSAKASPDFLKAVNGKLYFSADDGVHGEELWVSDGTPQGTFMIADTTPGPESSFPINLTAVGAMLFYLGGGAGAGGELWAFDTTEPVIPASSRVGLVVLAGVLAATGITIVLRSPRRRVPNAARTIE